MGNDTAIAWTDHSASPWHGCAHAPLASGGTHPGCTNCYAETMSARNPGTLGIWGTDGTRVKSKSFAKNIRRWNAHAAAVGKRETVFPSICDPFEDRPELVDWRQELFALADECSNVTLLLLTKRPQNVSRMLFDPDSLNGFKRRKNVLLGTSISDQATADELLPHLLQCRDLCAGLFVSAEPLLGMISLSNCGLSPHPGMATLAEIEAWENSRIDWLIIGGESGHGFRPMPIAAAESLVAQCQAAGVSCFVKQDSGKLPGKQGRLTNQCWNTKQLPAAITKATT